MKWIAAFFMIMLLSMGVYAAENKDKQGNVAQDLAARYEHLKCSVDLNIDQATSIAQNVDGTDLSSYTNKLNSDLAALKGYADNGQRNEFQTFMETNVKGDIKFLNNALKGAKNSVKGKDLKEKRQSLKDSWKMNQGKFSSCVNNAKKQVVNARTDLLDGQIKEWQDTITKLSAAGMDTTTLELILSDAEKLKSDLATAGTLDDEAMKQKIDEIKDSNLHLWARFHSAKIESYLSKIEANSDANIDAAKIAEIRALLAKANELAAPGKRYQDGEFKAVWDNIKQAQEKLKELTKEYKPAKVNKK